jgi:hypothetical protein
MLELRNSLLRFQKIPFTCSWLPGKSRMNMAFLAALGLLLVGREAAALERRALHEARSMFLMLAVLAFAAICLRTAVLTLASREKDALRFEEEPPPVVICLQLDRD